MGPLRVRPTLKMVPCHRVSRAGGTGRYQMPLQSLSLAPRQTLILPS